MKIGIIGCGKVFHHYAKGAALYRDLDLVACADADPSRAQAAAKQYGVAVACGVDELLARDDIELVLNLTTPQAHVAVDMAILEAGKHVYSEKPLAVTVAEAKPVLALAGKKGLRVGCAPDTFLGSAQQMCRILVDNGSIGEPTSGVAFLAGPGHEHWHPAPEFYYQRGGGPLLDLAPYYLHALVNLIGPVAAVFGHSGRARTTRTLLLPPSAGKEIAVEVDTHYSASLRFACGAIVNLIMSFDVWRHSLPFIELYGTEGSLSVPDPTWFAGEVRLSVRGGHWQVAEHRHPVGTRGAGAADLAAALRTGRPHRCSEALACHVIEVMEAIARSGQTRREVAVASACERPAAVPAKLPELVFD